MGSLGNLDNGRHLRHLGCYILVRFGFYVHSPEALWNPAVRGQCIASGKAQVVAFTTELAIDTVILSLPIQMVIALQLAPRRKFFVLMIFLLGGLWVLLVLTPISANITS